MAHDNEELSRIKGLTFDLLGYGSPAGEYQRALSGMKSFRDSQKCGHPWPRVLVDDAEDDIRTWRKACEQYVPWLTELHRLVLDYLPDTYAQLRILPRNRPWHLHADFRWDDANKELIQIRAAAAKGLLATTKAVDVVPVAAAEPQQAAGDERPKVYLFGWVDILNAVGVRYGEDTRKHVSRMNDVREGPITKPPTGGSPTVEKSKLIAWWNRLDMEHEAAENQRVGKRLDAEAQHAYGRQATVAPGVGGAVKKRRKDRKP